MDKKYDLRQMQEELLWLMPQWNCRVTKPFKQLLDEGVSIEMYYCLQLLRWLGGTATMSELGQAAQIAKQHMTKMVNRMVEQNFVERVYDPKNRRVIRIKLTDTAKEYIDGFLDENAKYFKNLLEQMTENERADFGQAVHTILNIFNNMPCLPSDNISDNE